MKAHTAWLLLLAACPAIGFAQQGAPEKTPTTTVSGHVYCADTNMPARMATVMLQPVAAEAGGASRAGKRETSATYVPGVKTLLDGSFTIPRVAPGMYYVIASEPGYISPFAALGASPSDLQKPDDTLKEEIAKAVPRITVQANLPASVEIRLERGAAVSGTILFDDGSPAAGLDVELLVRKKDKWVLAYFGPYEAAGRTDDQGAYRFSGLPALDYLVKVDITLSKMTYEFSSNGSNGFSTEPGYTLPVYSGASWREKDGTAFSLKQGEERRGEDIRIPISKLHNVRGAITASDGHTVNGGKVALLYADDKTEALSTKLSRDDSGFAFSFVPEGDYILRITDAADVEYEEIPNPSGTVPPSTIHTHSSHSYGAADQALHVDGDVSGLAVTVPEKAPSSRAQINP